MLELSAAAEKLARVRRAEREGVLRFLPLGISGTNANFSLASGPAAAGAVPTHASRASHPRLFPGKTFRAATMASIRSGLSHAQQIDVLKMDVQGMEHDIFSAASFWSSLPRHNAIGQLQLEVHGRDFERILLLVANLRRRGNLRLFNKEPNIWGCAGVSCVELSFVSPAQAFRSFASTHPSCETVAPCPRPR